MELEIFRAGDYGSKGRYTDPDLDRIVANYDPKLHEAPVVIGHPEHDKPAYGWVESIRREGSTLIGKLRQLQPAFVDLVKGGALKKRSIAYNPLKASPSFAPLDRGDFQGSPFGLRKHNVFPQW